MRVVASIEMCIIKIFCYRSRILLAAACILARPTSYLLARSIPFSTEGADHDDPKR
jgi:hypothetical protein